MSHAGQTVDEIYTLIRQAILAKNILAVSYRSSVREMCPHILGMKNGRAQALFYQFAGGSTVGLEPDGSPSNWRCVIIDELSEVSIRKSFGEWHTASNYSKPQTCVDRATVDVEASI